ncbi:MAG: hypothetical protein ACRESJ_05810 [Pseudomonas sp.]|uniref:hypothetical protein n=1 Tax=Pseudomonas sp. TaxID=306 RepID=UPI003D6DEABC
MNAVSEYLFVGAAAGCDLLILLLTNQKIAASLHSSAPTGVSNTSSQPLKKAFFLQRLRLFLSHRMGYLQTKIQQCLHRYTDIMSGFHARPEEFLLDPVYRGRSIRRKGVESAG